VDARFPNKVALVTGADHVRRVPKVWTMAGVADPGWTVRGHGRSLEP